MATSTTMKRGDLEPPLTITCTDNGSPLNLSGASSVRVLISRNGTIVVNDTAPDLTGAASGVVVHEWVAGETATAGVLSVEVEVTWPTARPQTFPPDGSLHVVISADLG